ncbi:HAD-like domain-containing protein, partial [Mycena filopes]
QLIYFDVYGTLIDSESGIFCALSPLLARSSYDFDRREALSVYHEVESELKSCVPTAPYLEILAQAHQAMALRLGLTSSADESSAFASSLLDWPLFPNALQSLQTLRASIRLLVAIVDMDHDTLVQTGAFPILGPYFDEVWSWDLHHVYRPDPYAFGPAVLYHDSVGVPRSQRCLISDTLFDRLDFGCEVLVPAVWMRNPAGL